MGTPRRGSGALHAWRSDRGGLSAGERRSREARGFIAGCGRSVLPYASCAIIPNGANALLNEYGPGVTRISVLVTVQVIPCEM